MGTATELVYDPYDPVIDADPHPIWKRLRDEAPLYRNDDYGFYALSRFDDVLAASTDWRTYSSARGTVLEMIDTSRPPGESPADGGEGVLWIQGQQSIVRCELDGALLNRGLAAPGVVMRTVTRGDQHLPVAVRGGGHSVAGYGTCEGGLLIDLSSLRGVRVDPAKKVAAVEGGTTWGDLDRATQAHALAVTGGIVSETGVAGLSRQLSAGEIASNFDVTRPAVSQDLTLLKEAGLVDERRNGTRRLYRARPEGLAELRAFLEEFWDARLEALKREAEREEKQNEHD